MFDSEDECLRAGYALDSKLEPDALLVGDKTKQNSRKKHQTTLTNAGSPSGGDRLYIQSSPSAANDCS